MRSALIPALLVLSLWHERVHAQSDEQGRCTATFQQRANGHAGIVDSCLVAALRGPGTKLRCRIIDLDPEAVRNAFENYRDTLSNWQQVKVQNSDRLQAQRIGRALKVDHVLLSSLTEDTEKALAGSNAALAQFREAIANGTHITDARSSVFSRFQYKLILVETATGKILQRFTYRADLTKPGTGTIRDRITRKFLGRFPLMER